MGFSNKMAPGVSESILRAEHESGFLESQISDLLSDFKNFKWQMQYGCKGL